MIDTFNTPDESLPNRDGKDKESEDIKPKYYYNKFGIGKITPIGLVEHVNGLTNLAKESNKEITGEDLLNYEIKEIPCLLEPFLQDTGLACLAGSSDTGKSTLLRQLAIAIVSGQSDFIGFIINAKHKSVIYVTTEDAEKDTAYLLSRQTGYLSSEYLKGLRFIFDSTDLLAELDKRLSNKPADLIIIDCFGDAFSGDLKDTQKIRTYLHPFHELAQKHQCLALFIHHTGKRTENLEPSKNNLLSGQGLEAKMRLVMELKVDLVNPNIRHLCVVKGNYLPASKKRESYDLKFDEQNFQFSNTGDRTAFESLVKNVKLDAGKAKFERAIELQKQGKKFDQIAIELGYADKSSVSKLITKGKELGWENTPSNDNSTETQF